MAFTLGAFYVIYSRLFVEPLLLTLQFMTPLRDRFIYFFAPKSVLVKIWSAKQNRCRVFALVWHSVEIKFPARCFALCANNWPSLGTERTLGPPLTARAWIKTLHARPQPPPPHTISYLSTPSEITHTGLCLQLVRRGAILHVLLNFQSTMGK